MKLARLGDDDVWFDVFEGLLAVSDRGKKVAGWQHIELDPVEMEKNRRIQRMMLARYGRQDYFCWEDREVQELDSATEALQHIIEKENSMTTMQEEHG